MVSQTAEKSLLKGAPGWMVTFADLMALLVALFVLILSFADFDEDGFAKKSNSIAKAFNAERDSIPFTRLQLGASMPETSDTPRDDFGDYDLEWIFQTLDALELVLATEIQSGALMVAQAVDGVVVTLDEGMLFAPQDGRLSEKAVNTLDAVGQFISGVEGRIVVSGHTDSEPVRNSKYTSNWDFSASRAAAVVQYLLTRHKVDQARASVQGFADSRPLNEGHTFAANSKNSRIEILLTQAHNSQ